MNGKNAMQTPPEGIRDVKYFLAVAINIAPRNCNNKGIPLMVESPDCDTAQISTEIAHKLLISFVGSEAK